MGKILVPIVGLAVVVAVGATLVGVVTLRPWAGADASYHTHLNFREVPPEDYTRTDIAWVETEPGAPRGWKLASKGVKGDRGYALYVGRACASCHGLYGKGTDSGPPVLGASERRTTKLTRDGTGGMPVYHEAEMGEEEMSTIAGYIISLGPAPTETPAVGTPTATPWPTATPSPTPTPTPEPTSTPQPTPEPGTTPTSGPRPGPAPSPTPTPTPLPTPTPRPKLSPEEFQAARQLYIDVGCDLCHGVQGEGNEKGSAIKEFDEQEFITAVREGVRDPESKYPREMDPTPVDELSDEELDQLMEYLRNLD